MEGEAFLRTLDGIKAAGLLSGDRKAAVRRATELSMGLDATSSAGPCYSQELLLFRAGKAVGAEGKLSVPQLKEQLRNRGCNRVANKLGRETISRNSSAHPVLMEEVMEALSMPVIDRDTPWPTWEETSNGSGCGSVAGGGGDGIEPVNFPIDQEATTAVREVMKLAEQVTIMEARLDMQACRIAVLEDCHGVDTGEYDVIVQAVVEKI